jgi:prepilin-type N-terminal cleavage/methylation domain-containing protein
MFGKANRRAGAFTLIELLIVVAIIAILAAIAVPNFLEAQTRAKVSRARADARTVATAVESYAVDNNKYPIPRFEPYQNLGPRQSAAQFAPGGAHPVSGGQTVYSGLTTPVAYLSSVQLKDPFADKTFDDRRSDLFYQNIDYWYEVGVLHAELGNPQYPQTLYAIDPSGSIYRTAYGAYKIGSIGPDRDYTGGRNIYDPTNGTVSEGDIYRSQNRTEGGGV